MKSDYTSVNDQSGKFAGERGYDITVGNHTELTGAVIASEAGGITGSGITNAQIAGVAGMNAVEHNIATLSVQYKEIEVNNAQKQKKYGWTDKQLNEYIIARQKAMGNGVMKGVIESVKDAGMMIIRQQWGLGIKDSLKLLENIKNFNAD